MRQYLGRIPQLLASEKFFQAIIAIFLVQALWFALSAVYPMAFDENFHFGLIRIYAEQWSPFLTSAPAFSGEFGPLTRDNSYFFHYLMSFPYRFIAFFVPHQEGIIIFLRLMNIGFFVGGIILFRALLLKTAASKALIHFSLLALTLIPVVPMLAAHVNYDNLIFLLLPIILLLTLRCADTLRNTNSFPLVPLCLLVAVGMMTSIVKYAFLPVFLAICLYLLYILWRLPKNRRFVSVRKVGEEWRKKTWFVKVGLIGLLIISGGLFIERYGVNVVQYKAIVPECSKVISVDHCLQYGPWARNYAMKADLVETPATNFAVFNLDWFNGMLFRLFFAINFDYNTKFPLPLPLIAAYAVAIPGLLLFGVYLRRIIKMDTAFILFLLVVGIYGVSIYLTNLKSYLALGELTAINGRYFIPLLPLIFILIGMAFRELFHRFKNSRELKASTVCVIFLLFLQGGGILTFLVRSEADWYWQSQPIITINESVKRVIEPLILFK